jgi:hypothetical protein
MDLSSGTNDGRATPPLRPEELNHLYEKPSPEERDELPQCLLIAAPRGEEAMIKTLEETLLCHSAEDLLGGPLREDEPSS